MPRTVATLAATVPNARLHGDGATAVRDLVYDSRTAGPGALFFCWRGSRTDGHDFAPVAVAAGAVALVVDHALDLPVPQIVVADPRAAMGPMAAEFFGHPSRAFALVGVTGTNGKTTTTFMLEGAFRALGMTAGVIGTVETHIGDAVFPVTRTTPESIDLQRLLADMREAGVGAAAMEVSSHGLHQGRVDGTFYACAVFTNLTQDHLDYHGTMEEYYRAKALLFRPQMAARAAINVDDPFGARLATETSLPVTTFGLEGRADVRGVVHELGRTGSRMIVEADGERIELRVPLAARYNCSNALGVLAAARTLGYPLDVVARGIESVRGVPGRLEAIEAGQDFTVLVDYAHTPDSLEGVLRAAREITPSGARLVVVFGCGGDRDRGKRPLMGRVGAALADRCIITSDNPRSEDPRSIIAMIEEGARETGRPYEVEPDRRSAIALAVEGAGSGDVIVVAGKGHESGQEFADHTVPFDDRVVARAVLEETWSRSR